MTRLPAFGNLDVETRETSVTLRLLTHPDGRPEAVFTYREIQQLSKLLGSLKAPEDEEDGMDLI